MLSQKAVRTPETSEVQEALNVITERKKYILRRKLRRRGEFTLGPGSPPGSGLNSPSPAAPGKLTLVESNKSATVENAMAAGVQEQRRY